MIDTRSGAEFAKGFVKGAINLPLSMNFAPWIGTLFPPTTRFFVATEKGKELEAVVRLARIGYDKIEGVLEGGVESLSQSSKSLEQAKSIPPTNLTSDMIIYDIRNPGEVT